MKSNSANHLSNVAGFGKMRSIVVGVDALDSGAEQIDITFDLSDKPPFPSQIAHLSDEYTCSANSSSSTIERN